MEKKAEPEALLSDRSTLCFSTKTCPDSSVLGYYLQYLTNNIVMDTPKGVFRWSKVSHMEVLQIMSKPFPNITTTLVI